MTPDNAIRTAIRHWHNLADLAEFAVQRHGFGDTDGGFSVTYTEDLDEFDRVVGGAHIPNGHVRVYGFWGPPDGWEVNVPETQYLTVLADVLAENGLLQPAYRILALLSACQTQQP